ncbi:MAG: hypothetical protein ACKO86_18360, partial [Dolichospermum sp.]
LIILKDLAQATKEIEKIGFFLSPLCLKYSVVISNLFYSLSRFEKEQTLMQNRKESAVSDVPYLISGFSEFIRCWLILLPKNLS